MLEEAGIEGGAGTEVLVDFLHRSFLLTESLTEFSVLLLLWFGLEDGDGNREEVAAGGGKDGEG
jgi:hypothetical protein